MWELFSSCRENEGVNQRKICRYSSIMDSADQSSSDEELVILLLTRHHLVLEVYFCSVDNGKGFFSWILTYMCPKTFFSLESLDDSRSVSVFEYVFSTDSQNRLRECSSCWVYLTTHLLENWRVCSSCPFYKKCLKKSFLQGSICLFRLRNV